MILGQTKVILASEMKKKKIAIDEINIDVWERSKLISLGFVFIALSGSELNTFPLFLDFRFHSESHSHFVFHRFGKRIRLRDFIG